MSLHSYLTRLIWLCMLPIGLFAAYLAVDIVRTTQSERDLEAANLARNFATSIDQNLEARIGALHILAASPLADDASRWNQLYEEAQRFHESFGSHVVLADMDNHMLFNTRVRFGTALPPPRSKGYAAASGVAATGKAAVGNITFGLVAKEPLVAIFVPGMRHGNAAFLAIATFELGVFQNRLEQVALPAGWALSLLDGTGQVIARRAPSGFNATTDVDAAGRFVARSAISPWTVALEIPREIYRAPIVEAAAVLASALMGTILVGALGGMLASRRLGQSVASLAETPALGGSFPKIAEIAAARRRLDESAIALRELNASLEQRVQLRTSELAGANKELDAFSYTASHDLRAPLQTIDGFSRALLEDYGDKLDSDAKDYLQRLRVAAQHMAQLVDDLLKLSRLTRSDMMRETVDLGEIAHSIADRLRTTDPARDVAFDIAQGAKVSGDKRLLAILMENLLNNAWKFTSKHQHAKIEFGVTERNGERMYYVRDDGAGFDMAYLEKLFVPFQRLHAASDFPGNGIGLATVRRVALRHGGRVWIEGEPEKGATIYFTIPGAPPGTPGSA